MLDIVRGLIKFDTMEKMLKALEYLFACDDRLPEGRPGGAYFAAAKDMARVRVLRVKDRMANPTKGGWADAMINFCFVDDDQAHACEVQFAHERMLTDRKEGGAHTGYVIYRAAFEILERIGELPSSELAPEPPAKPVLEPESTELLPPGGGVSRLEFAKAMETIRQENAVLSDELKLQIRKQEETIQVLKEENLALKNGMSEFEKQLKLIEKLVFDQPNASPKRGIFSKKKSR